MKKLNNASQLKQIRDEYFVKMMLPDSENKAIPYVNEEESILKGLLVSNKKFKDYNFIVIGSGTIWYIELAYGKTENYIAVEPFADIFIQKQVRYILSKHNNIKIVGKDFGDYKVDPSWAHNSIFDVTPINCTV